MGGGWISFKLAYVVDFLEVQAVGSRWIQVDTSGSVVGKKEATGYSGGF